MFGPRKEIRKDLEIFAIHDSKGGFYGEPILRRNELELIRDFTNDFNREDREKMKIFLNAEDFSLFRIGSYDRDTGNITSQNPEHILNFHDLRTMVNQQPAQRDVSQPVHMGIVPT